MNLKGIHHISAITAHAQNNYYFYTHILGMNLVKKTVNQDDWSIYHLFYADKTGKPGTDLTFFEIPFAAQTVQGVNSISRTSLRVKNDVALDFWLKRFKQYDVPHKSILNEANRKIVYFTDFEHQQLALISDKPNSWIGQGEPIEHPEIPIDYAIIGLGPVTLTVKDAEPTVNFLTQILQFTEGEKYVANGQTIRVFSVIEDGTSAEVIHLKTRTDLPVARQGRGSIHHVAFRVEDGTILKKWVNRLLKYRIPNSGVIDRYYFKALYFHEPNGILFELSTDGPGFTIDENITELGESLALPPHLESRREAIESKLKPLNTKRTRY